VVGTGTVLRDDPRLTVRLSAVDPVDRSRDHAPLRVVVGQRDIPAQARVRDKSAPSLIIANHNPLDVLRQLFALDVHHVLLEGGPTLSGAFVKASLVDRVVAYIAPVVLGAGANAINGAGIESIDDAFRLHLDSVERLGDDTRLTATVRDPTSAYKSTQLTSPTKLTSPTQLTSSRTEEG
ncbi:MAG: RibD family protein, partial [Candidatus Nanopelagicales bacterium]